MAESGKRYRASDRFMPCLLARLTDLNPQAKTETQSATVSLKQMKKDILKNIELILNSRSHPADAELINDPLIGTSVLMLGVSDFCGASHNDQSIAELEANITMQLKAFEPRIRPESLKVSLSLANQNQPGIFQLEISGRIEITPLRGEFLFKSRIDLENGTLIPDKGRNEDEFFRLLP